MCRSWTAARLPEAWKRRLQAAPLTRVPQLAAADRQSADDLLCHRLTRETELARMTTSELVFEPHDGLGADSEEKHEPASDIDPVVVDSLKSA
jgi:hypothetical protein